MGSQRPVLLMEGFLFESRIRGKLERRGRIGKDGGVLSTLRKREDGWADDDLGSRRVVVNDVARSRAPETLAFHFV